MRVIAGTARRLLLKTPDGLDTRPTADRIKETLFNMLMPYLPDAVFVDLFSGSGGIGIEALSRGARKAVFVDNAKGPLEIIRQNVQTAGFVKQASVIASDAESFLAHAAEKYDIIFLDPPYNMGYGEKLLPLLERPLAENGIVLFEHSVSEPLPDEAGGLVKKKDYRYGRVIVTSYVRPEPSV